MKSVVQIVFSALSCAALAGSIFIYMNDRRARDPVAAYLVRFNIQERRPDVAKTVGFAPAADWAADIVADAALRDAYSPIDLSNLTSRTRQSWIDAITHLSDELHASRDLLLDAIQRRPGWPFHQSLLGQVVFAADFRDSSPQLTRRASMWSEPLLNAAAAAPAVTDVWQTLAAAYVHTWPELHETHSATAAVVFRNAFTDPEFVQLMFPATAEVIGAERAVSYIPESPQPLRVAFDFFAARNDIDAAEKLLDRWQHAERKERAADLQQIESHSARGDVEQTRSLCEQWLSKHSVWEFDDASAHAEAQRILELWPGGTGSRWTSDPIADDVRYLLSRNGYVAKPAVILRAVESFSDVPPATMAEAKLAAGDVNGAEEIARAADDSGSLRWSEYLLKLAHYHIRAKNLDEAGAALKRLPDAASRTREALLLKADIASTREENSRLGDDSDVGSSCEAASQFQLRGARATRTVYIRFTSPEPALVDVGLNDARAATVRVEGERRVSVRIIGYGGQTLWYKRLAGAGALCAQINDSD